MCCNVAMSCAWITIWVSLHLDLSWLFFYTCNPGLTGFHWGWMPVASTLQNSHNQASLSHLDIMTLVLLHTTSPWKKAILKDDAFLHAMECMANWVCALPFWQVVCLAIHWCLQNDLWQLLHTSLATIQWLLLPPVWQCICMALSICTCFSMHAFNPNLDCALQWPLSWATWIETRYFQPYWISLGLVSLSPSA